MEEKETERNYQSELMNIFKINTQKWNIWQYEVIFSKKSLAREIYTVIFFIIRKSSLDFHGIPYHNHLNK